MEKREIDIRSTQPRNRIWKYTVTSIYLLVIVFLFWRCRYGFAYGDETFYLTIPYRICMGDRLLLHEWHLTQLSGILLVPLVKLFLILFRSTEGIVLFFRYAFVAVWAAGGLFLWRKLKRFSPLGAAAAVLSFALYAPYGIMALSYHSMSLLLLLAACVLLITNDHRSSDFIAGVLYAGAVLCSPFMVLLYPVSALGVLIAAALKNEGWGRRWLHFTGGVLLVFLPFCAMLLVSGRISDYLRVFRYILDDPQHPTGLKLGDRIRFLIYFAQTLNPYWKWAVGSALIMSVAAKITKRQKLGFVLICADTFFLLVTHMAWQPQINMFMFPACLLGLYCFLFSDGTGNKTLFWGLWIPGALYSVLHFLASNQYYYAFSHASALMMIAGLVMGTGYVSRCLSSSAEKRYEKIAVACALGAVLLCQLSFELITRYQVVYPAEDIHDQIILTEKGPEKGIIGNRDYHDYYVTAEADVETMNKAGAVQRVLFISEHTWLYLSAQKEFAAYSAWLTPIDKHTVEKLQAYYELFPEKAPDAIFFDRDFQDLMPLFEGSYYESDENVSEYSRIMRKTVKGQA